MNAGTENHENRRNYPARIGLTVLNVIAPGLGLFRVGKWRMGILFLLTPLALFILITFAIGHVPITNYGRALLALTVVVGFMTALYVVSAVLTWRASRFRAPARGWSAWYGLVGIAMLSFLLSQFMLSLAHNIYKPFYAPSETMAPTIDRGDKFMADMRWRGPLRRGEIVIFNGRDTGRVSRIAAIPGDTIATRHGVPIINGQAAVQSIRGRTAFQGYDGSQSAAMLIERLPDEVSVHRVIDTGPFEFDDMRAVVVPANHFFVLGDNRDRSADSRVPAELGGVGVVPSTAIIGRPMYIHWSSDRSKIGLRLDR